MKPQKQMRMVHMVQYNIKIKRKWSVMVATRYDAMNIRHRVARHDKLILQNI